MNVHSLSNRIYWRIRECSVSTLPCLWELRLRSPGERRLLAWTPITVDLESRRRREPLGKKLAKSRSERLVIEI